MQAATVYVTAIIFAILIFPVHLYSYLFVTTKDKFAAYNLRLYKFIPVVRVNTVKNNPFKMDVNGKESMVTRENFRYRNLELVRRLSILKVVQLGDYGISNTANASIAVLQNTITRTLYGMMNYADGNIKLKNYSILNEEGQHINYYVKVVNAINLLSAISVIILLVRGKLYEH